MRRSLTVRVGRSGYREGPFLRVAGWEDEIYAGGEEPILLTPRLLHGVTLSELRDVGSRIQRYFAWADETGEHAEPVTFAVADLHPDDYRLALQEKVVPQSDCDLIVASGSVRAQVVCSTSAIVDEARVRELASSVSVAHGARVMSVSEAWRTATEAGWYIELESARRGTTVDGLLAVAARVVTVVNATADGLTPATAATVIRAGWTDGLIGIAESGWLEAKSALWDLATEHGKIEMAQDVARFANGEGGLIVVGAATSKRAGEDIVVRVGGIRPDRLSLRRIRAVIDSRVYPQIEGMELSTAAVRSSSNVVAMISIPLQPASAKPFMVHGAIIQGRAEGAFISIVRRRGEGSITIGPREIHAWLVAGRQLMAGGRPPEE
jgi:hypothetical protein